MEKPVMGGRQPFEFTGEDTEEWSLTAVLFPLKFGGEAGLTMLKLMVRSGVPQYLLRGDGTPLGWMVVTGVTEKSSYLDASGIGKVITVDIGISRSNAPTPEGYYEGLSGLFGSLFK